tara:strand:- start:2961 stop:3230 length:270 start_codon:yes stop_codon:yes gene_type:complete
MPFYFVVYAKTDCDYCLEAINILNENGFDYVLTLLDKSPDYHHALKLEHDWPTVPLIFKTNKQTHENKMIGGCDDFKKWVSAFKSDGKC